MQLKIVETNCMFVTVITYNDKVTSLTE